jgi:hypothetical protein
VVEEEIVGDQTESDLWADALARLGEECQTPPPVDREAGEFTRADAIRWYGWKPSTAARKLDALAERGELEKFVRFEAGKMPWAYKWVKK